jgi:thymidylate kinase
MGKIINILGPHGVGKTTLQNYIRNNSLGIVAEGFILPIKGFNLGDPDEYVEYEKTYLEPINEQNRMIQNASENGYVIRSIEEIEYFLQTHTPSVDEGKIRELIDNESNIFCDLIIYLDSAKAVLDERIAGDVVRDQVETTDWYAHDYEKYDRFWKNYNRTHVIDTTNRSVKEVFEEIINLINKLK